MFARAIAAAWLWFFPVALQAACPPAERVAALASDFLEARPAKSLGADLSMDDARCAQALLVKELQKTHGRIVGYKAGLTSKAVQQRFNHSAPVRGVLLEEMLLYDGAEVPANFGARPVYEADLVVEVKDEGIHDATTPGEVVRHLSRIFPFIELPDLVLAPGETLNGPVITSINVGARLGVLGKPISVEPTPAFADALAKLSVVATDGEGKELARAPGSAILDHPLNAVIWLAADLKKAGTKLKAGDLLSLGSFSPPQPPKAGMALRVKYEGLPGNPEVSVRFR
ncbi:MAG: hydratase [Betaproteobacteria bacterium]|nr:hydratase [Betaproteobacteria bacterium]